jgi:glycosyltransferase involved in cell wall biosynthesis
MKTLSLCMIVRDEAMNLSRSLGPLMAYVDEAVVVDTGSQDGTPELASQYGARVFSFPWQDDFSAARNFSIDQAQGDWIFWLDADNRLEPSEAQTLRSLVQRPAEAILWCTEVLEPDLGCLWQKRIFPNREDIRFQYRVHEQLVHPPELPKVMTELSIYHWGYQDKKLFLAKGQRNFKYLIKELKERPQDFFLHYHLARHHFFQGDMQEVPEHLDHVLTNPAAAQENIELFRHARVLKARAWWRLGQQTDAQELLRQTVAQYPTYGLAWYYLGIWSLLEGKNGEAAQALNEFLTLGTGHLIIDQPAERLFLSALLARAQALRHCYKFLEALYLVEEAARRYPQNLQVWLEKAELAITMGEADLARRSLQTCLQLRPDNRRAQALCRQLGKL